MSIVLTGGNDRIATRYKDIFKSYKYKAKVFTQMPPYFENKLGKHAIMVVFINTCSRNRSRHKCPCKSEDLPAHKKPRVWRTPS